VEGLSFCY